MEEQIFNRLARRLANSVGLISADLERKYSIERLKALEATLFEGRVNPTNAEACLNLIEKCFRAMRCPKDCKVELATFLLKKG